MTPLSSIPSCLENFIGVRCLTTNPKSGLWINDLPGINLGYAADIVDRGGSSGLQFLQEKIDYATRLVIQDVVSMSTPFFRVSSIIDQIEGGVFKSVFSSYTGNKGIKFKIGNARLLRIRVNAIKIKTNNPATAINGQIIDGNTTWSFSTTTDADGYAEYLPQYLSSTKEVIIVIDTTGLSVNKTDVKAGCGCSSKASKFMTVTGWDGVSNKTANTTYGLVVDATAECNYDEFACLIQSKLPFPILFRAGLEIVKEAITTDRLNSITLLDEDKVNFLLSDFNRDYEKYMKALIDSLPELMKRIDDCCIVCTQSKYTIGRP